MCRLTHNINYSVIYLEHPKYFLSYPKYSHVYNAFRPHNFGYGRWRCRGSTINWYLWRKKLLEKDWGNVPVSSEDVLSYRHDILIYFE